MEKNKKKVAAITSAVTSYIQAEQAAYVSQLQPVQERPGPVFPVSSPWALSGRQAIMERRYQVQFKIFR